MKNIITFLFTITALSCFAQKQSFDLTSYTAPAGWKKQLTANTLQFTKEDAKGNYCIINLYKAVAGTDKAKENFDLAWVSLVKEVFKTQTEPVMQPSAIENGWEAHSGYAPFELDGNKGVVVLVTSSGFGKMVNLTILTNTDIYEKNISSFLESISLKKPLDNNGNTIVTVSKPLPVKTVAKKDGFTFSTTNFDDGWTAVVQEDWVEVTKGVMKVLLHYPKQGTIFPADPAPLISGAWNILVAPRYSNLKNFKTSYISSYDRAYLGMGYATGNNSGKEVFIVLFRQGNSGWIEFIAPDKKSFIQQYQFDPETIKWDSESKLMNPLIAMANYNKFAVAAADFTGSWSSDFSGVQQLYNVYTGEYAGMNMNQSNQTFQFGPANNYSWKFLAVNGPAGAAKVGQAKSAGKFTVLNNWQLKFSDIEGKPKTYNAFFSCIKGARLLHLLDAQFPGSGIYTVFGKK